jgi:2-polyprenyl-6-methoxyphenol hydroxylase-like FAD-dependent oxidoreductase
VNTLDIVVIGAGPAGATAALALARAGLSVAIVEKAAFPRRKVCGEFISATTWPILRSLGAADTFAALGGPPVRHVGLFAGDAVVTSAMPAPAVGEAWGRAVPREILDTALLELAVSAGARLWQPFSVEAYSKVAGVHLVSLEAAGGSRLELRARAVVAAYGSWERAPGDGTRAPRRDSDLIGFKAHFEAARLDRGLMPLVLFPGGYGGMVHTGPDRVGFSCCVRRDALRAWRKRYPGTAGDALFAHVMRSCGGFRDALEGARRSQPWLSAGPIRPGFRPLFDDGIFAIGNAAGEAHPLVAEGISMGIQSGWLLGRELATEGSLAAGSLEAAGRRYSRTWRRHFALRVRAASAFATLTAAPIVGAAGIALLRSMPFLLTLGAWWSGKSHRITPMESMS